MHFRYGFWFIVSIMRFLFSVLGESLDNTNIEQVQVNSSELYILRRLSNNSILLVYFHAWKMIKFPSVLILTKMICAMMTSSNGNTQRPVTRSFGVFFDLCLNKQLGKQSWGWWFETPSRPFWRHCIGISEFRDDKQWVYICILCQQCTNLVIPLYFVIALWIINYNDYISVFYSSESSACDLLEILILEIPWVMLGGCILVGALFLQSYLDHCMNKASIYACQGQIDGSATGNKFKRIFVTETIYILWIWPGNILLWNPT